MQSKLVSSRDGPLDARVVPHVSHGIADLQVRKGLLTPDIRFGAF